jgi:hypothetical protein
VTRVALALAALALVAGCGGSGKKGDPIPSDKAARMIALLELADRQASAGNCSGADAKAREVLTVVQGLPSTVDKDVRQGLRDGVERLRSLIARDCKRPQPTTDTTTTDTTPTDTTPTTTTDTTPTTTTDTIPTTTTDTTPTTTTDTIPTTTGNGGTPPPTGAGTGGTG